MNLFFTLLRRRAVLFGLLAVLLAAVIAFYCIAFSALDAVQTQRAAVSGQYTTVGIPKLDIDWRKVLFTRDGGLTALSQQDTTYPGLITEDRRVFMTAHVPGCQAVSAYERSFFPNLLLPTTRMPSLYLYWLCGAHPFQNKPLKQPKPSRKRLAKTPLRLRDIEPL